MSQNVFTRSAGVLRLRPFYLKSKPTGLMKKNVSSSVVETASEANSTWNEEKRRYLAMPVGDKRREYACGDVFYKVRDIKTWRDYVLDNKNVASRIAPLPGLKFDTQRNVELSTKVSLFRGDITTLEIDAIVNAANKSLRGGMGVDGAIHRAAGPFLLEENKTLNGCCVGEAKLTGGYKLPAKYVIPTVGPQGEKPELLRSCYRNAMQILIDRHLRTIAFPCISTGIYGYPLKSAAHVAVHEVRTQLESHSVDVDRVIFCLFSESDEETYQGVLQSYFPLE